MVLSFPGNTDVITTLSQRQAIRFINFTTSLEMKVSPTSVENVLQRYKVTLWQRYGDLALLATRWVHEVSWKYLFKSLSSSKKNLK